VKQMLSSVTYIHNKGIIHRLVSWDLCVYMSWLVEVKV
jgi:hypothetical protein